MIIFSMYNGFYHIWTHEHLFIYSDTIKNLDITEHSNKIEYIDILINLDITEHSDKIENLDITEHLDITTIRYNRTLR